MRPQFERLGFGNYIMIRKSDGIKLGSCGLYDREGLDGIDIGYALMPQFERQGYAIEAASKCWNLRNIILVYKKYWPSQHLKIYHLKSFSKIGTGICSNHSIGK